jgi:hypothetical protein
MRGTEAAGSAAAKRACAGRRRRRSTRWRSACGWAESGRQWHRALEWVVRLSGCQAGRFIYTINLLDAVVMASHGWYVVRSANQQNHDAPRLIFTSTSVTVSPSVTFFSFYYPLLCFNLGAYQGNRPRSPLANSPRSPPAARRCASSHSVRQCQKRRGIGRCSSMTRAPKRRGRRGRPAAELLRWLIPPANRSRPGSAAPRTQGRHPLQR